MKYFNLNKKRIVDTNAQNLPESIFVPLSSEQVNFLTANPQAFYREVWDMRLNEAPAPDLEKYKAVKIKRLSALSLKAADAFMPDYKLKNALSGVYNAEKSAQIVAEYKAAGEAFRNEFYRVSELINTANSIEEVDAFFNSKNFDYDNVTT
jgi:hypothetical protein